MLSLFLFITFYAAAVLCAKYEYQNNFPVRYQWGENMGYCGEVSLITAGLNLGGQYLSQYDSRIAACGSKQQSKCEMLIGVNDQTAATAMHLQSVEWGTVKERSTQDFLLWVKQNTLKGYAVIIGVFMNYYEFYNVAVPSAGDADYDHIVPVLGIRSNHPLNDTTTYYDDDEIIFSDNGLYGLASNAPYVFSYTFKQFQKSRENANTKNGDIYSLPNTASNYGLYITGIADKNSETLPIRIDTNLNYEKPEIVDGSNTRPNSMGLTLTATVSGLTINSNYNCYRYTSLESIPESNFNSNASKASQIYSFKATATNYSWNIDIQSNEIVALRCVKAT
eukprot:gene5653-6075_t